METLKVTMIASKAITLNMDLVDRDPGQPRKLFNEESIRELAQNLKDNGLIHPIYIRPNPEAPGRYIIVAGERRFRALTLLGVREVEFRVVEDGGLPPYIISIIENNNREDLNPMEEAESYREAMERENLSVMQLAAYTGKHFTTIYRALRLLKLPPEVQALVREGKLRAGKAYYLHQYKNVADKIRLAEQLIAGEDPPEISELDSAGGNTARIAGHLPKTADGLIRRLLGFRRRGTGEMLAMKAFLALSEEEQVAGWQQFTHATRANFVAQMTEIAATVQLLSAKIESLPDTKRIPSGIAAIKSAAREARLSVSHPPAPAASPAPATPPAPAKPPAPRPAPLKHPSQAEAAKMLSSPLEERIKASRPAVIVSEGNAADLAKATLEDMVVGEQILEFLQKAAESGSCTFWSVSGLSLALGNGHSPEEAERLILRGLRTIRAAWRSPMPKPDDPNTERLGKFVSAVAKTRFAAEDLKFSEFLRVLQQADRSPDPVRLERL